ncbi:hypothetical protein [Comamonas thiooxydans]|uniref:hypothetical protein n=1 Tax=Comamonas thiooxydans TaxID=363952 RepID=UPI001CCA1B67|nr:hypothetical protein [Comamonas thiooxydans]UBQ43509.1 hypothetical protein LCH15_08580 [Comamonas thiooxydans]
MNLGSTPFASALATHSEALEDAQQRPPGTSNCCTSKAGQFNRGNSIVKLERFGRPMEIDRNIMGVTIAVDDAEMPREGS